MCTFNRSTLTALKNNSAAFAALVTLQQHVLFSINSTVKNSALSALVTLFCTVSSIREHTKKRVWEE